MNKQNHSKSWYIKALCIFFNLAFFVTSITSCTYLRLWDHIFDDWIHILVSPSPLVTDYFQIANLPAAFFNAGMCGLACTLLMIFLKADCTPVELAGYFLVVAHCFYGLNFLNMWPPILGILLFCKFYKVRFSQNLGMAMYATAFGPFISELLFRYHVDKLFMLYQFQIDWLDLLYVVGFSIFLGFAIPAMLPGALRLHKGFNLYNGGLAFGLLGLFLYSFMYKTIGIDAPGAYKQVDSTYPIHNGSYPMIILLFFLVLFTALLFWGWLLNGKSFNGYSNLLNSSGHNVDFIDEFGIPLVLINIGTCGYMMLAYFTAVILLTEGAGFSGPTTGVILASLTFTAKGQHPKNVFPILLGFILLSGCVTGICIMAGREIPWTLSTQGYMNGAAFATGLCPIAGHYGKRYGVIAGFICAVICTSTSVMHGGFMLYNGGLAAGITALIMIPCLEYYWKEPVKNK